MLSQTFLGTNVRMFEYQQDVGTSSIVSLRCSDPIGYPLAYLTLLSITIHLLLALQLLPIRRPSREIPLRTQMDDRFDKIGDKIDTSEKSCRRRITMRQHSTSTKGKNVLGGEGQSFATNNEC